MANNTRDFHQDNHYHVYNRGNDRNVIFRDAADRRFFLSKLDYLCDRYHHTILAYCLMSNHFHLSLHQRAPVNPSRIMQGLCSGYTRYYNHKYGTVGSLFQGRFQAKTIPDEEHMARLTRYIHLNPAPFFDYKTYRWSSYRQYVSNRGGICVPGPMLDFFGGSKASYAIFCAKAAKSKLEALS